MMSELLAKSRLGVAYRVVRMEELAGLLHKLFERQRRVGVHDMANHLVNVGETVIW